MTIENVTSELPFHEAWRRSLPFLYRNSQFVNQLSLLLKQLDVEHAHDGACGLGFPSISVQIALKQLDHAVTFTCSDGDQDMLNLFEANQKRHAVRIQHFQSLWHELPDKVRANKLRPEFDALFCIGNSLSYAMCPGAIATALSSFHQVLKMGGVGLIDLPNSEEYDHDYRKGPYIKPFGEPITIEGERVTLEWEIRHEWHDSNYGLRELRRHLTINGRPIPAKPSYSCLLKPSTLIQLGANAGFSVQRHPIPGEFYQTYLGTKLRRHSSAA